MVEKILIVDDDLETVRLIGMTLQRQGYKILAAENGIKAIEIAKNESPDLIILDIMMPDLDGFEVARKLRKDKTTLDIPILMFTAKGMVEDKISGYDAGADDYLTKPIHPAELMAHVKALLLRKKPREKAPETQRGYTIGVMSVKGGLGVSTFTLNLAISLARTTKLELIASEIYPGHGSWGYDLGYKNPQGLNNLLKKEPYQITTKAVQNELVQVPYGIRVLMSSNELKDNALIGNNDHYFNILETITESAPLVLFDYGANYLEQPERLIEVCDEIIVITNTYPNTVKKTETFIKDLAQFGVGEAKMLRIVVVNNIRSDMQLSINEVSNMIGKPIATVITPAPELAYHSAVRAIPMIELKPDGLIAQQTHRLSEAIAQRVMK
jgi:CheY-like chemotaxis protein